MSDTSNKIDSSRREFLSKSGTVAGAAAIAPGVFLTTPAVAKPDDEAVTSDKRWGILVDTNKCASNCDACVSACKEENGWGKGDETHSNQEQQAQWIRKVEIRNKSTGFVSTLPLMCQHCETPPCVDVCPTGASFKRIDGLVLVDKHICIGCRYCMMACPFKARSFIHEDLHEQLPWAPRGKGTVESCTLCVQRIDKDGTPACVEACSAENHNALIFGDLNDENSEISRELNKHDSIELRADLGLNTGVRYRGI
jgi:molybdopterin-containing oxidoreductase family iron-sulfur binding subunit